MILTTDVHVSAEFQITKGIHQLTFRVLLLIEIVRKEDLLRLLYVDYLGFRKTQKSSM